MGSTADDGGLKETNLRCALCQDARSSRLQCSDFAPVRRRITSECTLGTSPIAWIEAPHDRDWASRKRRIPTTFDRDLEAQQTLDLQNSL